MNAKHITDTNYAKVCEKYKDELTALLGHLKQHVSNEPEEAHDYMVYQKKREYNPANPLACEVIAFELLPNPLKDMCQMLLFQKRTLVRHPWFDRLTSATTSVAYSAYLESNDSAEEDPIIRASIERREQRELEIKAKRNMIYVPDGGYYTDVTEQCKELKERAATDLHRYQYSWWHRRHDTAHYLTGLSCAAMLSGLVSMGTKNLPHNHPASIAFLLISVPVMLLLFGEMIILRFFLKKK